MKTKRKKKIIIIFVALSLAALIGASFSLQYADILQTPVLAETTKESESLPTQSTSKIITVDPTGQNEGYSAVLYDSSNGLPTSEANAIVQASDGSIWIGNYSGLIHYDANTFNRIDSSFGISSVVCLYIDSNERIWIGSNDSGVTLMDGMDFTTFNKSNGLSSLYVRAITEDCEGNIILATTDGLAYIDSDLSLHKIDTTILGDTYILNLSTVTGEIIYGVTRDGSIFTIKNQRIDMYYDAETMGINDIHCIVADPNNENHLYVGTNGSEIYHVYVSYSFEIKETYNISPYSYTNAIHVIDDTLWICTDVGVGFIDNGTFESLTNLPMTAAVEDMMVDYLGNLWFVSSQQGIMKIVANQFTDIFLKYNLDQTVVYSTLYYNDTLYIGTKNDGLTAVDSSGNEITNIPITYKDADSAYEYNNLIEMLKGIRIRSVIADSKGKIWISTFSDYGLVCYDNGVVSNYNADDGLPSNRVRAIYESDSMYLVVCTGGLAILYNDDITTVYNEKEGISNTEVLTACENADGCMVLGTDGGGLYIIGSDTVSHYGTDEGLSSDVVMRVKQDVIDENIIWIVTSNTISYMTNDGEITAVTNFPYSNNFDLYQSANGHIWVLSSNGIYVVQRDDLINNTKDMTYVYYGMDNGLPCIASSNSYSCLTSDGDLYMAGTTGVAKFNINHAHNTIEDYKMSIPYIKVDGEFYAPDSEGKIYIPSSAKKIQIYAFVFNYSLTNPTVTYKLSGLDDSSITLKRSELTYITYTNLSGGTYTFNLEISNAFGTENKSISVVIIKEKKLLEKLWFRVICYLLTTLAIVLIVVLYVHHKIKQYQKKANKQKQLIKEIVEAFAKVIDMKDKYTNGHSTRVAQYTAILTRELGYKEDIVENYYNIAMLHDIGKIGIPPEVLNKPKNLTDEEYEIIKSHASLGYEALKDISIMPELAYGAGGHHERPDGKGYPNGLKGNEIPRVAQIIAVADTFDAMYSKRPYRDRMNFDKVVEIIKNGRGTQLTADVVDAFLRLVEKGEFRDPEDTGGGSMQDIDNIKNTGN